MALATSVAKILPQINNELLGDLLVKQNYISQDQLQKILQKKDIQRLQILQII